MADKYVLVINPKLPLGLIANAAAVLGVSLGQQVPGLVGPQAVDKGGDIHTGLIQETLPVLKAEPAEIARIRAAALTNAALHVIDFSEPAQRSRTYPDYIEELATKAPEQLAYLGIALYGEVGAVKALTGALPLLR